MWKNILAVSLSIVSIVASFYLKETKMWKKVLAYSVVSLSIISFVGALGYSFYMGGWISFFIFIGAWTSIAVVLGSLFLIVWAFCYVFKS